jgi:hypothetical protein
MKTTYGFPAVATWGATTLLLSDLHQSLLATSTDSVRAARRLLHGKRSQDNGRNAKLVAELLKCPEEGRAGVEGAAGVGQGIVEGHDVELVESQLRGSPSSAVDTTVQKVDVTVGTGDRSDFS